MKRYVKEFHKDMVKKLLKLQSERNQEYLMARLRIDKALDSATLGIITDYEAIREMINAYEWVY